MRRAETEKPERRGDWQVEGARAAEGRPRPRGACAERPEGRGSSAGRPRAPPGARPGERKAREGRAGEGSGAREGLSARRFWLKYSKWRTEEQRVKMRVQPRRQQQQTQE